MTEPTLTTPEACSATFERVEAEFQSLKTRAQWPHGLESDIVKMFLQTAKCGHMEDRIPQTPADTIVCEMAFRFGRADIVIFHVDGSASVIEVKDGTKGYNHVVAGIGQASLYAAQLSQTKGAVTKVRKCLLWTSTGNTVADALIETACEQANTVALPWGSLRTHLLYLQAVKNVVEGGK